MIASPESRRGPLAAVALSLLLLGAYWAHPSRVAEARALYGGFYARLPREGVSLDGSHISESIKSGAFTEWTLEIARAALVRRNLRSKAPHALDELQQRWSDGLWKPPDPKALEVALDGLVADWNARRAEAASLDAAPATLRDLGWNFESPSGARDIDDAVEFDSASGQATFEIAPPRDLATSAIGSLLILEIDRIDLRRGAHEAALYWSTANLGVSANRRIVPRIEPAEDPTRLRLTFDFANEPGWLARGATVGVLRVDLYGTAESVQLRRVAGGDSAVLRE